MFALADTAFAFACNSHGEAMVAAGASIEFLAPAVGGERLIATAHRDFAQWAPWYLRRGRHQAVR